MSEPAIPSLSLPDPSDLLASFDHQPRTRIVYGEGIVERVGELARETGIQQALVVTDAGIAAAGHLDLVRESLDAAGVKVVLFDKVRENPTTADVENCLQAAKGSAVDGIIGLGGGSSLDTAKGCNFLLTNGGRMHDYWGVGKARKAMLPLIAIPTTAGTGSECQSFALIADVTTHQKMACGDPKAAARVALLDPALTLSQPPRVTACTGLDALSHALESAVARRRTMLSLAFSRQAFALCSANLRRVLEAPDEIEGRAGMLLGAALGGLAIENSMLGAAHAAANPLTAHFNVLHGLAVGIMLPGVMRFNAKDPVALQVYNSLDLDLKTNGNGAAEAKVEHLAGEVRGLLKLASLPRSLADCGVKRDSIPMLAAEAARQWTGTFNPRTLTEFDFVRLYEEAFEG
jgi:alcohol dehydrogenase